MRFSFPIVSILLGLALSTGSGAEEVHLSGARMKSMQPPDEARPERAPGPRVVHRSVVLEPLADGVRIRARWRLDTDRRGWFAGTLAGAALHVETLELPRGLSAHGRGSERHVYGWIDGPVEISMVAVLHEWTPGTPVELALLTAPIGEVSVAADDYEAVVQAGNVAKVGDSWWTGAGRMRVQFERQRVEAPARRESALLTARAGVGVTVLDRELVGRARLSWKVLRGAVDRVSFSAAGLGADFEATGPNIRSVRRNGNVVTVELNEPSKGRVDLDVRWSEVIADRPEVSMPLATLRPTAFRVEHSIQVARDGDREVVPSISGIQPTSVSGVPEWGSGLVDGAPTAAWVGSGSPSGSLSLLRFEPVTGPPAVVDAANYTIATSSEGRVLMRAHYEVRNERAQWLDVRPPPGMRILGARVGSETAFPIAGEGGTWRIPLTRSVETVEGLLTFPVELAMIGEIPAWQRREERQVALPTLNADVALSRVTLYLPPGYVSRLDEYESDSVPEFVDGEGLGYGFAVGDTGAAQADALFQDAVAGWMDNDFSRAQSALDELRSMGGDNENVRRLQSNLDLVEGSYRGDASASSTRRIREQARARGLEDERQAVELKKKAEKAQVAGDYAGSNAYLSEYMEITGKLQQLEQEESYEYKAAEADARRAFEANVALEGQRNAASQASLSVESTGLEIVDGLQRPQGTGVSGAAYGAVARTATDPGDEAESAIASIFDDRIDPLREATGEFAGRDLIEESAAMADADGVVGATHGGSAGGYGMSGSGLGGGGSAEGLGGLGSKGRGSGASGYGSGGGNFGARGEGTVKSKDITPIEPEAMSVPQRASSTEVARARGGARGRKRAEPIAMAEAAPEPPPPPRSAPGPSRAPGFDVPEELEEEDDFAYEEGVALDDLEDEEPVLMTVEGISVGGRGRPSRSGKSRDKKSDVVWVEPDTIDLFTEEPDAPEVTATALSIVVPNLGGETVRYQKLLLDAGETPVVLVRARNQTPSK